MTLANLLFVYVLGGITFVPLLLAAILIPAWRFSPRIGEGSIKGDHDDEKSQSLVEDSSSTPEGAASGTFAVLRSFDFAAANAALATRNSQAANGTTGTDGDGESSGGSESVYQSMYRSVFDRGKSTALNSSVLEKEDATAGVAPKTKKNVVPVNIFHIVLRHGHLMLYDSAAQVEVRHVISMSSHTVSLSEGGSLEQDEEMRDGDLFIKRTAIVLTPVEYPSGQMQSHSVSSKPFYLFSTTCSEKEDFYHALLYTRKHPPIPIPLDAHDAIKLQSALHSTSLTAETRALNALVGRVFLALYRTDRVKAAIQRKIEKKISRISKPAFIASLAVHAIDLGDAAPVMSNPKLKDLNVDGDMTISCDVRYDGGVKGADGLQKRTGGIKVTISALAKLDLGARFKTRTVDLLLATSLQRLHGRMLIRIKPPPSNRIWFCFETPPEMDIKVEPVVSQRQITYTFVLRAIEERIRAVVIETLVKPNWDDIPFFDTTGQRVRGGIWKDEGIDFEQEEDSTALSQKNAKTMSMPTLVGETDSSGASSGSEANSKMASGSSLALGDIASDLKRRSVASLPLRSSTKASEGELGSQRPSKLPRTPSFTKATVSPASVAVDDANAEQTRANDVASPSPRMWRIRPTQIPLKKEAMDAMREMRDRASRNDARTANPSSDDGDARIDEGRSSLENHTENDVGSIRRDSDPSTPSSKAPSILTTGTLRSPTRTDTSFSTMSTSSSSTANSAQHRKNLLAATAAATTAARNWSWNALANARNNRTATGDSTHTRRASTGPMGRGQPLPPPGTLLPGPQKPGIFGGLSVPVKRKPVASSRRGTLGSERSDGDSLHEADLSGDHENASHDQEDSLTGATTGEAEMEYGPWTENSGLTAEPVAIHDEGNSSYLSDRDRTNSSSEDNSSAKVSNGTSSRIPQKAAPPLPARRAARLSTTPVKLATPQKNDVLRTHEADVAIDASQPSPHRDATKLAASQHKLKRPVPPLPGRGRPDSMSSHDSPQKLPSDHISDAELANAQSGAHSDSEDGAVIAVPAPVEDDEEEESEPQQSTSVFEDGEGDGLGAVGSFNASVATSES